ncbi:MAG: TIGR02186 family protein [Beijerinckiaceae bacterium]
MTGCVRQAFVAICLVLISTGSALAERLITSVSSSRVLINSSYTGAELVLFGAIERDGATVSRSGTYDIVVTIKGPASSVTVREKRQLGPLWVNADQMKYSEVPGYLAILSSRAISDVTSEQLRERFQIGLLDVVSARGNNPLYSPTKHKVFHDSLVRLKVDAKLFQQAERGVVFLSPNLFRAAITLPATSPLGNYEAIATVYSDGAPLASEKSDFEVVKTGFEARTAAAAYGWPFLYGLSTVLLALVFGWLANYAFRRD